MTTETGATPSPPPGEPRPAAHVDAQSKNPYFAALLALFPGAGHVYNGLYMRGITFFLIVASLIGLAHRQGGLFGFAIAFFWIFNVLDTYRQATLINLGLVHDLGLEGGAAAPRPGQGGIAAGVLMFAIGLFALVDHYVYIDLDWIFDLWPVALMAAGAWIAWSSWKERRAEETAAEPAPDDEPF